MGDENNKKSSGIRISAKVLLIIVLILIIAVMAVVMIMQNMNQTIEKQSQEITELLDQAVVLEKVNKTVTVDELAFEINKIGELATIEYVYTNAGKFTDGEWLAKKSFIARWDGVIKAGINLDNINYDIDESDKTITVTLPKAEILSHEVDTDNFETLDESKNIFNQIKVDDVNSFISENQYFMEDKAISKGLLEKAEENAKAIIENGLMANIIINENYTLVIKTAGTEVPAESETTT